MIIISIIKDRLYAAPFLKNKTTGVKNFAVVDLNSVSAADDIREIISGLLKANKGDLFDGSRAAVFMDERKSHFASIKNPRLEDERKLSEFVRWSVRENYNIDNFEYSFSDAGNGYIYVHAVETARLERIKGIIGGAVKEIVCLDTHLFNEINFLKRINAIESGLNDFTLVKIASDSVGAVRFLPTGAFERIEFDFMSSSIVCDYGGEQSGYGAQELMLMHEMVKKIARWQNDEKKQWPKPQKLILLNSAGGQAPYYLRLRLSEEISDNLYYVNQERDYLGFNIAAMCDRWM
ncbi:MAG TPA: hypothetical protein PKL57_09025 [Candidatus Wallbacteria bacterium]|nr:hypothetical protein [Candidatus Wallbacteria bacterium]